MIGVLTGLEQAAAQVTEPPQDHAAHLQPEAAAGWHFMNDGVVFAEFNHQGGLRGGNEVIVPNWWMGMATRETARGPVMLTAMLSVDAATLGKNGYREVFQVGEAVGGTPLVDHQHPHDLFMQLAAIWRIPLGPDTGMTLAGGPVGEPALGPVAFMHRPSAAEYALAPLSHHTFDSTHIAFGVVSAAVDHGRWVVEGSLFNGREPDEDRWDFDFAALDSYAGRVSFRPDDEWELSFSTGHLAEPEELEAGDVRRTTMSASWWRREGGDFTAATTAYGVNASDHGSRHAVMGEITRRDGLHSFFTRLEVLQVETAKLLGSATVDHERRDTLGAFTFGAVRDVVRARGFEGGLGAAATVYAVPEVLQPTHGRRPVSVQVFFRLRPPAGPSGRMWNMRMSQPMVAHAAHQAP
jgi:hypothetical protein